MSLEKKTNMFVVLLSYKAPLAKIDEFRSAHLDFLNTYYAANVFIISGPQVPRNGGIIVAKCDSKESLQEILAKDPFAAHDLASYEIIEFSPTKSSNEIDFL